MIDEVKTLAGLGSALTVMFAAVACAALIVILRPWLGRYALTRPNARSSHREATPQGGGIAVVAATIAAAWLAQFTMGALIAPPLPTVFAATIMMACVGAADDIRPLAIAPRLLLQALAVAAVIYSLPDDLRFIFVLPWWIERALLVIGGLWFVNLVNFMDGIDWMTVAEVIPVTAGLAFIGILGVLPLNFIAVALALGGTMIGFAYFNRPVAKLFLGDVGSLPVGLLLGWLLVTVAGRGSIAAAVLLPLYYLADATITLLRRLLCGERIWTAHRSHFYQRATDHGFSVTEVVARVFIVNLVLATLAIATVIAPGTVTDFAALTCGAAIVSGLLATFARARS